MTHRRIGLVFLVACAVGVWTSLVVAGHAGDGPAVAVRAHREQFLVGGGELIVYVTVGSSDPQLSATIDPAGVATDGFVQRLVPSPYSYCPDPAVPCTPCPSGSRCFSNRLRLDVRLAGRVLLPVSVIEGNGRVTAAAGRLEVRPAVDADADGMPDVWEDFYHLRQLFDPHDKPDDDPDGDGVTNLEEFRRGTNPKARYQRYFAEASAGDRPPGLQQCFEGNFLLPRLSPGAGIWITLLGDDGRRTVGSPCISPSSHVADRVVSALVESSDPFTVERVATPIALPSPSSEPNIIGSAGVDAPSTRWLFADGGTDGVLDTFYLFFNPGRRAVDVTMTYRRDDGRILRRSVRRLEPGVRTTVWVNADDPALGRVPASTEIVAGAPVLVERAWRFDPPGRTVTQPTASPGVAVPSRRWIFPEVDGRPGLESSIVITNPSTREALVDVSLIYDGEDEHRAGALRVPSGGRATIPARRLAGMTGVRTSVELVSTNGTDIVAERTILAHDDAGPWRVASAGSPTAGSRWVLPAVRYSPDIVVTNVSAFPARVEVFFDSPDSDESTSRVVDIAARRRFTYTAPRRANDTPRITSLPTPRGTAELVVELVRRGVGDGVAVTRATGVIGTRVPDADVPRQNTSQVP